MATYRFLVLAAALSGIGVSAQAALISGVTTTSSIGTWGTYSIAHLTDGSGLSAPISLASTHDGDYMHMWMSGGATSGTLVFDLGKSYELSDIAIWQYDLTGTLTRGVRSYSLDLSEDGVSYATLAGLSQLPMGTGLAGISPTVVNLPADTIGRYVRMTISQNWGASSFVGLSEVQFNSVPAPVLPEPTAIVGMAAASTGLLVRKRQKTA